MSNDATVRFGYDGTELNRGLSDAERRISTSSRNIERNMSRVQGRSSSAMRSLGGASMQVQDIAVQLQMGTRLSTVIAQQGSQMLSVFGPAGAILGGVVAVGGAFVMMGQNATKAFEDSKLAAKAYDAEFKKVMLSGDGGQLASHMEKVQLDIEAASKELADLSGAFNFGANIADITGGPSVEERINKANEDLTKAGERYGQLVDRALQVSQQEVQIARLRADGREEEARQMERSASLAREIARIEASKIPMYAKEQLIIDARAKSALLMKQAADAERASLDKRAKDRQMTREDEMRSLQVLDLRSRGREREADKIERKQKIEAETLRIRKETGASEDQARGMAEQRVALEENINRRNSGQRSRIVARPRGDGGMGGGIDEFNANQMKDEVGFNQSGGTGYGRGQAVHRRPIGSSRLSGPTQPLSRGGPLTRGGGIDGFRRNQLPAMSTSAAAASSATSRGDDLGAKIDRTNELLTRGLLGN